MRKYVLSASLLTMLAPSALAEGALQYRECRQSGDRLGWFAVSYTVQAGQRTQKSAQDLSRARTRADYEQSRQAAATWGEKWPSLQRQTMDNQRQNTNDASNGRQSRDDTSNGRQTRDDTSNGRQSRDDTSD